MMRGGPLGVFLREIRELPRELDITTLLPIARVTPHGGIGELSKGVDEVVVRCARHVAGAHNRPNHARTAEGHAQAPARQGAFLFAQPVPGLLAGPASGEGAQQIDLQSPHNPTPGSLAFNMLQVVRNRRVERPYGPLEIQDLVLAPMVADRGDDTGGRPAMILDTSEIRAPVIGEEKRQRVVRKFRGIDGETVRDQPLNGRFCQDTGRG